MATIYAGKGKVNSYNPYISLTVSKSSQSIAGNYTIVDYALKLHRPSEVISSVSKDYSFKINGTEYSGTYTIGGSGTKTIKSGTQKIAHNSDGSKSISYSMSVEIAVTWGSTYIGTVSNSSTLSLPTIPRATTLTIGLTGDKIYMGDSIAMSMIRASSSFTHDLAYSFAGGSYVSIATGVGTSKTWETPDLASKIPNATSGTLKVRCITKNGSTTIGTTYASITLYVPTSVVPTVSALTATEATSGLADQFGAFIQGKSKISCKITGAGAKGSTIKEYQATFAGSSYTTSTWTSPVLATSGTLTIKARVKDSRGRWSAYKTLDVNVLAYAKPVINKFEVERCDADGTLNTAGEYLSIKYKYSVTSLGSKNTASMTVSYKQTSASSYTTLLTNTSLSADKTVVPTKVFSNSNAFDLKMEVTDWFGVTPYPTAFALVPTEEVIFDIKANGLGFAVGGVATEDRVLDSFWPIHPREGVRFEWTSATPNLNTVVTNNALTVRYNKDFSLVEMRGYVTIKPTAAVSAGAEILLGTMPEGTAPTGVVALSVYRVGTGTGWIKAVVNTSGEIKVRPGAALTAGATASYYLAGTYYKEF